MYEYDSLRQCISVRNQLHSYDFSLNDNEPLEILRQIPSDCIVAFFDKTLLFTPQMMHGLAEEHRQEEQEMRFRVGDKYFLQTSECEGFETLKREYEIKGVVDTYETYPIDALIVKQISGEHGTIYSLSKGDCKILNIPYEKDLMLMPKAMDWIPCKKVEEVTQEIEEREREFDSSNLATYPLDFQTKSIAHITFRITNLRRSQSAKELILPDNRTIDFFELVNNRIVAITKHDLYCFTHTIHQGTKLHCRLITPIITHDKRCWFDANRHCVYLEIDCTNGRKYGIMPDALEGAELTDIFDFCIL